jgi:hypothetical protein
MESVCILQKQPDEQVIKFIGKPDAEETDEDGDLYLSYEHLNLSFTFFGDYNNYLGRISTERESAVIEDCKLIGKDESEIKKFIEKTLKARISEEKRCIHDNGDIQSWIEIDELNITFWFLNGILYLIDWSCEWIDNDTPNWPRESKKERDRS